MDGSQLRSLLREDDPARVDPVLAPIRARQIKAAMFEAQKQPRRRLRWHIAVSCTACLVLAVTAIAWVQRSSPAVETALPAAGKVDERPVSSIVRGEQPRVSPTQLHFRAPAGTQLIWVVQAQN